MEIYILDSLLRRIEVVDKFESLIWTERYDAHGDFQLVIKSTRESRNQFISGSLLAMNLSNRVMRVDTAEDSTDADGKAVLKVTGYSLEILLRDRAAKDTLSNLTVDPRWVLTGLPADIARMMFDDICRTGTLSIHDIIPFITPGSIYPASTIPEPSTGIIWTQQPDSLYNALRKLCSLYDLGFRLVRNFDASQLYFDIYSGNDRTTRQSVFPPVIFAPDLDNLQNTTELSTTRDSKNVAYVFSEFGSAVVYPDGVDPSVVTGFDRRVLVVHASDITESTLNVSGALEQAGKEALLEHRNLSAFDGELNQNSAYRYGVDYDLGDLCELRNIDGVISARRVSEQIFVCDAEGERSYPTLMANDFIMSGTWLTMGDIEWADFTTEQWVDL